MKIASIYPFKAFPPKGGNHLHALQLIRQFLAEGHEVLTWGDDSIAGVRAFPRDADGGKALEVEADVLYIRLDGNKLGADPRLVELIRRTGKPIVWEINSPANENLAFSYLGGDRTAKHGIRRVLDDLKRRTHAWRQLPGMRREDALRRELARSVYAATCVSSGIGKYAREALGIANVHVIPNGSDPDTHRPTGDVATLPEEFGDNLKVLYAGSPIYPWQGLHVLQETMKLCAQADDPIRFILLLNQASPAALGADNAQVLTAVSHQQVAEYLRAADVAVVIQSEFPWSRWGSYFSPMKLYDYMACGRPVVGSRIGQIAEVIEHGRNGFLFDNTPEGLRRCLLEIHALRPELPRIGAEARADVEHKYNWNCIARETIRIFEAALAERSTSPAEGAGARP